MTNWVPFVGGVLAAMAASGLLAGLGQLLRQVSRYQSRKSERERLVRLRERESTPEHIQIVERALPPPLASDAVHGPYYYLRELQMRNFRCFDNADVSFRFPGEGHPAKIPNVNLLLGDNGSGKSTVLRAAAMVALGPVLEGSGFAPFRLVRQGHERAVTAGTFAFGAEGENATLRCQVEILRRGDLEASRAETVGPFWPDIFHESTPSFFVVGYGVNRRVSDESRTDPSLERGKRRRRFQRVSSLFDDNVSLTPIGSWLRGVDVRRRTELDDLLRRLLPANIRFTGDFEGDDPVFTRRGAYLPFPALSDGFRSYVGWLGDLLYHVNAVAPAHVDLADMGGIVLVDEIDLLLHPSWQRFVVPAIAEMFPRVQFIFTTHSPIVTGTLEAANIHVTREREAAEGSGVDRVRAEIHGLSAEQVLLSSYFELTSTRAPDAVDDLADLARRAVDGDEDARRQYLRSLAEGPASGRS